MSHPDPIPEPPATQPEAAESDCAAMDRRAFLRKALPAPLVLLAATSVADTPKDVPAAGQAAYKPTEHNYAMAIDPGLCIGCGRCAEACKTENDVPREPFYFRTWVERYIVQTNGETAVSSPNGGIGGFPPTSERGILRSFFVPKLCNHCAHPPCVQVCPVGATFVTQDGVVLVDQDYCVGCRYCIQACPYGARFLNPVSHTADKCTFCYHRLVKGLAPACVEACPAQARIFGELWVRSSPISRFLRLHQIQVLKPHLNTEPKVYYVNLDGEVR